MSPGRTQKQSGGEGGIRTPDRLAPMPHFECGAFNHSATSPGAMAGDSRRPRLGRVLGEDGGPDKARGPRIRALARQKRSKNNGASDGSGQWRSLPRRADRARPAAALAARLAGILADL